MYINKNTWLYLDFLVTDIQCKNEMFIFQLERVFRQAFSGTPTQRRPVVQLTESCSVTAPVTATMCTVTGQG